MGMYDDIVGECPHCGLKEFCSQTKLLECVMTEYRVGSDIDFPDSRLELKNKCYACGGGVVAVVASKKLVALEKFDWKNATHGERPFGSFWERDTE